MTLEEKISNQGKKIKAIDERKVGGKYISENEGFN